MAFSYKIMKVFAIRRARYSVRRKGRGILSLLHAGRLAARAVKYCGHSALCFSPCQARYLAYVEKGGVLAIYIFCVAVCRIWEQSARVFLRGRCRLFETIEKRNEREIWIG